MRYSENKQNFKEKRESNREISFDYKMLGSCLTKNIPASKFRKYSWILKKGKLEKLNKHLNDFSGIN